MEEDKVVHILLVDDHTLFREAILQVLNQLDPQVVIFEAANAEGAAQLITHTNNIDLVLLDLNLPDLNGLIALPYLRELAPTIPIVVLSASEDPKKVQQALDKGAVGYLPKSCSIHEMLAALRIVMLGEVFIPPKLLEKLGVPALSLASNNSDNGELSTQSSLTPRQMDVLSLMAKGLPNKSIARELTMAEGTVKLHVATIFRALGTHNRTQAVTEASRLGLLPINTNEQE